MCSKSVDSLSDEDLGKRFRSSWDERIEMYDELCRRGYHISLNGHPALFMADSTYLSIYKNTRKEL